jgi:hypothetical protein
VGTKLGLEREPPKNVAARSRTDFMAAEHKVSTVRNPVFQVPRIVGGLVILTGVIVVARYLLSAGEGWGDTRAT